MKVAFRVDASDRIGSGHQMRCMTLAASLRARGARIQFICRDHGGNLIALLRQAQFSVNVLPAPIANQPARNDDYAAWLGVDPAEDAQQTVDALAGKKPDWLVVDHYALNAEWERRLLPHVGAILVIDDLANRLHSCDALLDQNYHSLAERRYASIVAPTCRLLIGPRYALLRPEYAARRETLEPREGPVDRILIFFGGSDIDDMTGSAFSALFDPSLRDIAVDVVIGANYRHRKRLEAQASRRPMTTVHDPRPHLADLMARADLAIGAGGATTWERMCLALPTFVISTAPNQRASCEALSEAGLIEYLGSSVEIELERLHHSIRAFVEEPAKLREMAARSQKLVDGLGTSRVTEVICPTPRERLHLRPARPDDAECYFVWANDPEVRGNSFDSSDISWTAHQEWFSRRLGSPSSHLFVLEAAGLPLGQIRFEQAGEDATLSFSLDALVRGRGWGRELVAFGINRMQSHPVSRIVANVKSDNAASCAIFSTLGFNEVPVATALGYRSFRFELRAGDPS